VLVWLASRLSVDRYSTETTEVVRPATLPQVILSRAAGSVVCRLRDLEHPKSQKSFAYVFAKTLPAKHCEEAPSLPDWQQNINTTSQPVTLPF
jgi:hypothetical protein